MRQSQNQSGQVLLLTLLVLSIAMTVVLSLIGRTTTNVSMSNQIVLSQRAFSAAEAGIEETLKSGAATGGPKVLSPGVSYEVSKADIGGAIGVYQFQPKTAIGSSETVWLVNHNGSGDLTETPTYTSPSIDICWSSETVDPAVYVTLVYKRGTQYRVANAAYDPSASRRADNRFSAPQTITGGCGAGTNTTYKQTVVFADFVPAIVPAINPGSDVLLLLRLTPLYNQTHLAVSAGSALPLQGNRVESSGFTTEGVTRKIIVYQQYSVPSMIFDAAIVSNGDLVK